MYNKKEINSKKIAKPVPIKKPNPYKYDAIVDPKGQWTHPGEITKIPSNKITMKGVPYPVLGVDNKGNEQMMYPGAEYTFPGQNVTEYPQIEQEGGWLDKYDPEFKSGGTKGVTKRSLTVGPRGKTKKNMQSSINFLQLRNTMLFGPSGHNIYDPKSKFEGGGWLDKYK